MEDPIFTNSHDTDIAGILCPQIVKISLMHGFGLSKVHEKNYWFVPHVI